MPRAALTILALAALAALFFGKTGQTRPVAEDPPVASRPSAGDVAGTILPSGKAAKLRAVSRATGREYKPDAFDAFSAKRGKFTFKDLPGDATYDLCIETADGARIEGIDLSWHEARLLRLAAIRRQQLGLPSEKPRAFTPDDVDELLKYAKELKDFTDLRRVLYVKGDGPRATALVEAMRTTDFYARQNGEVIWRMELWYFEFRHGSWERAANVERVLVRERTPAENWRKITLVYDPALSVYVDEKGGSKPVNFTIPDKLDPSRGRLAGSEPVQETKPNVIGLSHGQATTAPKDGIP